MNQYSFQLYVSDGSPGSTQAVHNLQKICETLGEEQCLVEVINIRDHPKRAEMARVMAIPTLIKTAPYPVLRVIGNLSDRDKILKTLGIC
jgi:circadian clock protein KaiB